MVISSYFIWIDENIDNEDNAQYIKELESIYFLNFRFFKKIDQALNYIKYIKFQETKVIISDKLYSQFVKKFKENIIDMSVAPNIIVFKKDKENLIEYKKEFERNDNLFYKFGGIASTFDEIKKFLKDENISLKMKNWMIFN